MFNLFALFNFFSDLNRELGKMKELLNDIVVKMSNNLVENGSTEEGEADSDDRKSSHGGSVSETLAFVF